MKFKDFFGMNIEHSDLEDLVTDGKAICIAESMSGGAYDTLMAVYRSGMLESGEIPCKTGRDWLLEKGVLVQTCKFGSDFAFSVSYPLGMRVIDAIPLFADKIAANGRIDG